MTDDKDLQETLLGGQVDGTEKPETMDLLVPVPADLTGFSLEGVDGANGELRQGAFVGIRSDSSPWVRRVWCCLPGKGFRPRAACRHQTAA